ncbi:MAG: D-2-hydroxyacid dehydrogenase [Hyphomicrobiaceae bacterium]|nr:D-2-hydroxyacid dehydrogenase [Hyphomicrobiaceae bacterium]
MTARPFPAARDLNICFAHQAYQLAPRFALRNTGLAHFAVTTAPDLVARAAEADVIVVSGLWRNDILEASPRLRFVQSVSAGINQYDQPRFRAAGVRLASAQGANEVAVAEHAMALMLALKRLIHTGRDNQQRQIWRGMISDIGAREDESAGKTMLIVGYGRIGQRLARLARAFDMRVIGVRRNPGADPGPADAVSPISDLQALLPQADVVVLTCPLTPETTGLIGAAAFAAMKPSAVLVNVARGAVVDEPALIEALQHKRIAAAGIDVTAEEPLSPASPLWRFENALITPHTAGETRAYEDNVIDLLLDNLARLAQDGSATLRNGIV